jgi:uncharacterized protein with HEPN domain
MLDAIDRILVYTAAIDSADALEQHPQTLDAVIRNIEVIGEAANKIARSDAAFVDRHPQIPWTGIRGMRNKLIHDYFEVDSGLVWATVRSELPALTRLLKIASASLEG